MMLTWPAGINRVVTDDHDADSDAEKMLMLVLRLMSEKNDADLGWWHQPGGDG